MTAPRPATQAPFWTWGDAALFLSLSVPSLLMAIALSRGIFLLCSHPPGEGVRLLVLQFIAYGVWFCALWLMLKSRYDSRSGINGWRIRGRA